MLPWAHLTFLLVLNLLGHLRGANISGDGYDLSGVGFCIVYYKAVVQKNILTMKTGGEEKTKWVTE